jgi:hypothetical protein
MKIWLSLLCLLCLLIGTLTVNAAPPGEQKFPPSSDSYQDQSIRSLSGKLVGRVQQEPFNAAATIIFFLAITHTFLASRFQKIAHQYDVKVREIAKVDSGHDTRLDREWDRLLFRAQFFHFMGEIEAVFGIWLVPLVIAIVIFHGWSAMISYVGHANMAEAVFVVVIMAMASSLPILRLAENAIARIAALGRGTPTIWWLSILTIGPILGSFITEPAAMTISALLLRHRFYNLQPGVRLKYATLGLLFVNISLGGTLTHFAAPPVVMVSSKWARGFLFMLQNFGWKVGRRDPALKWPIPAGLSKGAGRPRYAVASKRDQSGTARSSLVHHIHSSALSNLDSGQFALPGPAHFRVSFLPGVCYRYPTKSASDCAPTVSSGRFFSGITRDPRRSAGMVDHPGTRQSHGTANDDWLHDINRI